MHSFDWFSSSDATTFLFKMMQIRYPIKPYDMANSLLIILNSVYLQFDSVIVLFRLEKNRVNVALYLARE